MPNHGITALVDFIEPFEAKKAFTKLAYSQFKSAPLYLEWSPENIFVKSAKSENIDEIDTDDKTVNNKSSKHVEINEETSKNVAINDISNEIDSHKDIKQDTMEDEIPDNDTTLFVKNLNFKTTEESLKAVSILFAILIKLCHIYFISIYFITLKYVLLFYL